MELICPSCEARYQLAEGAIGEKGRQVSCMNCGHGWHAYPPIMLQSPAAPSSPVGRWKADPETRDAGAAALATAMGSGMPVLDTGRSGEAAQPSSLSRSEQLAEIRGMLAEVQSEDRINAPRPDPVDDGRTRIALKPEETTPTAAPRPDPEPVTRPVFQEPTPSPVGSEPETDPLRERLNANSAQNKPVKRPSEKRLRKAHDRKERRRKRREAAGSGAFLTGFLVVVMVVALMTSIYLLHPQIIEKVPSLAPALNDYVATIDGLRVNVAETFSNTRDWVLGRIEKNA